MLMIYINKQLLQNCFEVNSFYDGINIAIGNDFVRRQVTSHFISQNISRRHIES